MLDINKIELELSFHLSEYRYLHSERVALEAKKLAHHYGVDEESAYIAGLLHDVAKEFSKEENRMWIDKYGLSKELLSDDNIKTCHAEIGAVVAKELYGVSDLISQAICYHTVGNKKMNILDKIVFVADKIECGKNYPGIEEERVMAYQDIDKALILCLENNKKKLDSEGKCFHPKALELLQYLLSKN